MEPDEQADEWRAPYISYQTLVSFIDGKLGANPLPPRIDRGFLDSYAGSVQALLLQTLRTMGFIKDDGSLTEALREAARHTNARKAVVKSWASQFYSEQQQLAAQNATAQMLHESFAKHKYTGSTLRKAVVFYLTLADDVGLPKSPHFKPPRQYPSQTGPRRKATASKAAAPTIAPEPVSAPKAAGERKVVSLGAAGRVTVDVDVRWLDLPIDVFTKLRTVIADLEALGSDNGSAPAATAQEEESS